MQRSGIRGSVGVACFPEYHFFPSGLAEQVRMNMAFKRKHKAKKLPPLAVLWL
jgi:hypothetical protein